MELKPKLRYFEVIPQKEGFLIRDPLSISKEMIFSKESFILLSLINGENTIKDIKFKFLENTGILLSDFEILNFIESLDRNYLLYNERFLKRIEEEKVKIKKQDYKEVNSFYNFDELKKSLDNIKISPPDADYKGIIIPHIDLRIGMESYKKAFSYLKKVNKKIFLILGVPHFWSEVPFSIFDKKFKVGDKVVHVEREIIKSISKNFDYDITDDVFAFKNEHSIDFPVIFISFIDDEKYIIPSLISTDDLISLKEISDRIFEGLKDYIDDIFFISSVDLSHVGRKFGDENSFDPEEIDREYINFILNMDNEGSFNFLEKNKNSTRIDGKNTNFVFLNLIKKVGAQKGNLLDYKKYYEKLTDSFVTFTSIVFE